MKKNKLFILGLVTVFVALVSLTLVSSTWAKYTTTATGTDTARVAYWGFNDEGNIEITDLFVNAYDTSVNSDVDVIAPGTSKEVEFEFNYSKSTAFNTLNNAPEVDYTFTVSVNGSSIDDKIKLNKNILWSLDGVEFAHDVDGSGNITKSSWDKLMEAILALAGTGTDLDAAPDTTKIKYEANSLPAAFKDDADKHKVGWEWAFAEDDASNEYDTDMGNTNAALNVKLVITITATQEN